MSNQNNVAQENQLLQQQVKDLQEEVRFLQQQLKSFQKAHPAPRVKVEEGPVNLTDLLS